MVDDLRIIEDNNSQINLNKMIQDKTIILLLV